MQFAFAQSGRAARRGGSVMDCHEYGQGAHFTRAIAVDGPSLLA